MSLGENIKRIRKEQGISQRELAARLETSPQNLAQYENNKRNPKIEQILKIATALEVSIDELTQHTISPFSESSEVHESSNTLKRKIAHKLDSLNTLGQQKALEQIELLAKISEYRQNTESAQQ